MPRFSPEELADALRAHGVASDAPLCVAFSGGLDSTVLLRALSLTDPGRVRAVHVDHQLHADSTRWRTQCETAAAAFGVRFAHVLVHVDEAGEGLEAAARRARYAALRALLLRDEVLLTAHHADDQLESVVFALVRGAGVNGLRGILPAQPFGPGRLVRPLLGLTRAELAQWAQDEGLAFLDDPSNKNTDLDRNYLRRVVLPTLRERWPAAAHSASRSASHLGEAAQLLASIADADMTECLDGARLSTQRLAALTPARRRNVLRRFIHLQGVRTPSTRKLAAMEHDLLKAGVDRSPCVDWDDVEMRRHRGLLYLERKAQAFDSPEPIAWDAREALTLPAGRGRLTMAADPTGGLSAALLAQPLQVRFRVGGESLKPHRRAHRRSLKKLLQEAGVPAWRRAHLPLIYSDGRLIAVGDLWIADECAAHDEPGVRIVWERDDA